MKITFLQSCAGPNVFFQSAHPKTGKPVYDLPDDEAKSWIESGLAVAVATPKKKTEVKHVDSSDSGIKPTRKSRRRKTASKD